MSAQPEALRLADELDAIPETGADPDLIQEAATKLRRLHEANEAFGQRQEWWNEKMFALEVRRDVLLEALRALVQNEGLDPYSYLDKGIGTATASGRRWLNARAAIKAAEETK